MSKTSNQFIRIFILLSLFFLNGFSSENTSKHTHLTYYKKISSAIDMGQDKEARESFLSLLSKYPKSSFLEPSLLLMINYYTKNKNYEIASFYLKRLKENFINKSNKDYVLYLQTSLEYEKIKAIGKSGEQVVSAMEKLQDFLDTYPNSRYKYNIATMYSHLYAINVLNSKSISFLYESLDKKKATSFYKQKYEDINISYIHSPKQSLFEKIF